PDPPQLVVSAPDDADVAAREVGVVRDQGQRVIAQHAAAADSVRALVGYLRDKAARPAAGGPGASGAARGAGWTGCPCWSRAACRAGRGGGARGAGGSGPAVVVPATRSEERRAQRGRPRGCEGSPPPEPARKYLV